MSALSPVPRAEYRRLRRAVSVTAVFLIAVVTQGAARPDYDPWHQSISALSLGARGWIQDAFFLLLGLVLLSTVPTWYRILRGGIGQRSYPVLTALTGLSLVAAALWPQDPAPGYDPEQLGLVLPTTTGLLHLTAAGIGAFSSVAAMFVMGARFRRLAGWEGWARPTRRAAVLTALCVVVYAVWSVKPTGFAGTFERLVVIVPGIWGYAVIRRLGDGVPFVITSPERPAPVA
jgi:hypothetical protein